MLFHALLAWILVGVVVCAPPVDLSASESLACDFPVVDVASLAGGFAEFAERFQQSPQPVVLEGLTASWPISSWGRADYITRLGSVDIMVRPTSLLHRFGSAAPFRQMPLREYLEAAESPGVAFENDFPTAERAVRGEYSLPPLFAQAVHAKSIFSVARRGDSIGFHSHHVNWLAQLQGRKAWFIAGPEPGVKLWTDVKEPCRLLTAIPPGNDIQRCIAGPSQTVFVPSGFYHATCNLDDFTVGLGWEGDTRQWHPAMHAIVDGDVDALEVAIASSGTCSSAVADGPPTRGGSGSVCAAEERGVDEMLEATFAARAGHLPILQRLLDLSSDATALRALALAVACEGGNAGGGNVEIARRMLDAGAKVDLRYVGFRDEQPLHLAAESGHVPLVELLVSRRAKVESRSAKNDNALLLAARHGHEGVVESLLRLRADVRSTGADGHSHALSRAVEVGHLPVARLLLQRRANPEAALHFAAKGGHSELIAFLLDEGADVRETFGGKMQAIHLASGGSHAAAVETLLQRRADARAGGGPMGGRPLHMAAANNAADVLSLLLASRASPDEADNHGVRPLHLGARKGHAPIVEQLLSAGAQWQLRSSRSGERPADLARGAGHLELAERLEALSCGGLPSGFAEACQGNVRNYSVLSIDGVLHTDFTSPDAVRDLRERARLRAKDVVIATYPRCGTTWMQQIVLALLASSDEDVPKDIPAASRWLEGEVTSRAPGAAEALDAWRPASAQGGGSAGWRVLKTHAPAESPPWESLDEGAKIIVVARNPKDVAVSNFHHSRETDDFQYRGSWDHFLGELFMPGRLVGGCFWHWHSSWWRRRREQPERVLWLSYEELSANLSLVATKVAAFLGLGGDLEERAARVVRMASFAAMERSNQEVMVRRISRGLTVKKGHIRVGRVGTWREHFSAEQAEALDSLHARRCQELDLPPELFGS